MKKYRATIFVDANVTVEVDANSEEEAKNLAMDTAEIPCLCHQCDKKLDVGDFLDVVIIDELE